MGSIDAYLSRFEAAVTCLAASGRRLEACWKRVRACKTVIGHHTFVKSGLFHVCASTTPRLTTDMDGIETYLRGRGAHFSCFEAASTCLEACDQRQAGL